METYKERLFSPNSVDDWSKASKWNEKQAKYFKGSCCSKNLNPAVNVEIVAALILAWLIYFIHLSTHIHHFTGIDNRYTNSPNGFWTEHVVGRWSDTVHIAAMW